MRRLFMTGLLALCLALAILYVIDYGLIRFGRDPFGSVIVTRYYVIPKKNGKTEFLFQAPESEKCVHSLFSHQGYAPCWYLNRRPEQPINL
jgi:hypothetical protein